MRVDHGEVETGALRGPGHLEHLGPVLHQNRDVPSRLEPAGAQQPCAPRGAVVQLGVGQDLLAVGVRDDHRRLLRCDTSPGGGELGTGLVHWHASDVTARPAVEPPRPPLGSWGGLWTRGGETNTVLDERTPVLVGADQLTRHLTPDRLAETATEPAEMAAQVARGAELDT